jgi:hypothetical protein
MCKHDNRHRKLDREGEKRAQEERRKDERKRKKQDGGKA